MKFSRPWSFLLATIATAAFVGPAIAQDNLDRADPARQERDSPRLPDSNQATPGVVTPDATVATATGASVFARDIRIEGTEMVPLGAFSRILADYRGRRLDVGELRALAGGIADAARARGYPFATAWVPAQALDGGTLIVQLDEGRVDEVRLDRDDPAVARMLAPLTNGRPVTRALLERQLLLAGDLPGVTIKSPRFQREAMRGVLLVKVERDPLKFRFGLDNYATDDLGPVRARGRVDFNGVLAGDDRFTLEGVATPIDPREFQLVGAGYDKGFGASGATVSFGGYYARTRPGGELRDSRTRGESWRASAGATYPLVRMRHASLWVSGNLYHRESRQSQLGAVVRDDNITAITVDAAGHLRALSGYLTGRITATRGLDILDATRAGDVLASRRDGDGRFTKVEAHAAWTGDIAKRVSLKLAAEGQIASRALLSSEEFGIGGPRFLRAYDYSEEQGDEGIAGLAELRYDLGAVAKPTLRGLDLYTFVDGGSVRDIGRRGSDSLASAGAGISAKLFRNFYADVELAVPLTGPRDEDNSKKPRLGIELRAVF